MNYSPKLHAVVMEIPQNYPTFTLSDPLKMGQFNDPCKTFISWSVAWLGEKHVDEKNRNGFDQYVACVKLL